MANVIQRALTGGELAPSLHARTDFAKYLTGLRTCRNAIVQRHGGVVNRPGFVYIAGTKTNSARSRILPFVFNSEQTYVLELGDQYIRFIRDGGQIAVSGVSAWVTATDYVVGDLRSNGGTNYYCKAAHTSGAGSEPGVGADWQDSWHALSGTIFEVPTPYLASDLAAIRITQSADVLTIVHPSHPVRELRRTGHTAWTLTDVTFGPAIDPPTGVSATGGAASTGDTFYVVTALTEDGEESLLSDSFELTGFEPTEADPVVVSWTGVVGARHYNIYRSPDNSTFAFVGTVGGRQTAMTDTAWSDSAEEVNTTFLGAWAAAVGQMRNPLAALSAANKPGTNRYTVAFESQRQITNAPGGTADFRVQLYYKRDAEGRQAAGAPIDLTSITTQFFGTSSWAQHLVEIEVPDNGYTTLEIDVVPECKPNTLGGTSAAICRVRATSLRYNRVEWTSDGAPTTFSDDGLAADDSYAPPTLRTFANAADKYPSTTTYWQQRHIFANSNDEPEKIWCSRTGMFKNFTTSTPLSDADCVIFNLAGLEVNAVRALAAFAGKLIVFTSSGEWVIQGDADGVLTPQAINPAQYSYNGIVEDLAPLILSDTALYVQAQGGSVHDFFLEALSDGTHFKGNELSLYASHLFEGYTITEWAYQKKPNSVVWAVRSDGVLLGLTYMREHEIWAWHKHDTDGVVESVVCVPEDRETALYAVVQRTVNGSTVRYIERLASREHAGVAGVFLDAAIEGTGVFGGVNTVFSDLAHLEGEEVAVIANGVVLANPLDPALTLKVVTGGQVSFAGDYSGQTVVIGLPYITDVETLDIDTPQGESLKDKSFTVQQVGISILQSKSFYTGREAPSSGTAITGLTKYVPRGRNGVALTALQYQTDTVFVNIESQWNSHGRVFIRQIDPLPLTILSIIPKGILAAST
jgi:hypothetical protein